MKKRMILSALCVVGGIESGVATDFIGFPGYLEGVMFFRRANSPESFAKDAFGARCLQNHPALVKFWKARPGVWVHVEFSHVDDPRLVEENRKETEAKLNSVLLQEVVAESSHKLPSSFVSMVEEIEAYAENCGQFGLERADQKRE